ncbi:MAG: hypothetical protein Ct9H90mP25_0950 [Gammaproteobacteria bacterium]|nr:MAG: hypothetical protein Ct9H90mP25_0950 [Gammaproteobacteria bacterium]
MAQTYFTLPMMWLLTQRRDVSRDSHRRGMNNRIVHYTRKVNLLKNGEARDHKKVS